MVADCERPLPPLLWLVPCQATFALPYNGT